jgi:hypothetical protein
MLFQRKFIFDLYAYSIVRVEANIKLQDAGTAIPRSGRMVHRSRVLGQLPLVPGNHANVCWIFSRAAKRNALSKMHLSTFFVLTDSQLVFRELKCRGCCGQS